MTVFLWVIDFVMLIMSVVLLTGKGSGLIAGYNTASEKAKSKFDEKKLCRTTGGGLLVLTVLLAALLFMNFEISNKIIEFIFIGLFIVDILMMFILGNTVYRRKQP